MLAWTGSSRPALLAGIAITVVSAKTGRTLATSVTGELGVVEVSGVPAGRVQVHASFTEESLPTWAPDQARRAEATVYEVRAGQVTDVGDISVFFPGYVVGHVRDTAGQPLGLATVELYHVSTGKVIRTLIAGADGRYGFSGLYPVGVKVRASLTGYVPNWADSDGQLTWTTTAVLGVTPGAARARTSTARTRPDHTSSSRAQAGSRERCSAPPRSRRSTPSPCSAEATSPNAEGQPYCRGPAPRCWPST